MARHNRYDLSAAGQLTAAHASGSEVDYVFEVVGRTATGVEAKDSVRYTEALAAACKDFAALNPQVAVACPF